MTGALDISDDGYGHFFQFPILFGKEDPQRESKEKRFGEVMAWVTAFLEPTGYVAGTDHMTVADLAFVSCL